jgi:hypothetical protein
MSQTLNQNKPLLRHENSLRRNISIKLSFDVTGKSRRPLPNLRSRRNSFRKRSNHWEFLSSAKESGFMIKLRKNFS